MADDIPNASNSALVTADGAMNVTTTWNERVVVLSVRGVIDVLTAPLLEEAIDQVLPLAPAGLIVDMSDVDFLASAGMMVLVAARSRMDTLQGLVVVADGPATSRPMKLIGIDAIIGLHQTLADALLDVAPTTVTFDG